MTPEASFSAQVSAHLRQLNSRVDSALSRVARQPPAVRWLLFEYDSSEFADGFPLFVHPMLADGSIGAMHVLLQDGTVVVPASVYRAPEFEDIEPWDLASELFEKWLVERWSLVSERPPAFVAHHDSFFRTDLADGSRTNNDDIAARFAIP